MKNTSKKHNAHNFLVMIAIVLYAVAVVFVVIGFRDMFDYKVVNQNGSSAEVEYHLEFDETSYFTNAGVFFVWGSVLLLIARKMKANSKNEDSTAITQSSRMPEGMEKPVEKIYCAYCDNELDLNEKKCPYCGASKKYQKQ